MKITIAVTLCHALTAGAPSNVCREEVVYQDDMPLQACIFSQAQIAQWKEQTIFRGEDWRVAKIRCVPGNYSPRDAI